MTAPTPPAGTPPGEPPLYGGQPAYGEHPPPGDQPPYGEQPPPTAPAYGPATGRASAQSPGTPNPPAGPRTFRFRVPLRLYAVWVLLALAAIIIAFGFFSWIFPAGPRDFFDRFSVGTMTGVEVLVAPLLALLIATKLGPVVPHARLAGQVALAEYAAALALGVIAFLFTIISRFTDLGGGIYAFGGLLGGLGSLVYDLVKLALLALAALWTLQLFTGIGGRLPRVNVEVT